MRKSDSSVGMSSASPTTPSPSLADEPAKRLAGLDGRLLCKAFGETFDGGGWADAPEWANFDRDGQRRWERAAEWLKRALVSAEGTDRNARGEAADAVAAAYEAGAMAVHEACQADPSRLLDHDPEFAEAAHDYAASRLTDRKGISKAAADVLAERARQVSAEGWTPEHDDQHTAGELARAAATYAAVAAGSPSEGLPTRLVPNSGNSGDRGDSAFQLPVLWPWAQDWWKPKSPRQDLERAGALIIAEMERLDRASGGEA